MSSNFWNTRSVYYQVRHTSALDW